MNIGGLVGAWLPLFFVLALGFLGPVQTSGRSIDSWLALRFKQWGMFGIGLILLVVILGSQFAMTTPQRDS